MSQELAKEGLSGILCREDDARTNREITVAIFLCVY